MRFCLDDGAVLIDQPQPSVPTYLSSRAAPRSSGMFSLLAVVGLVLGGITVLAVAGIAGVWYYAATREPVVTRAEPSATPLDTPGGLPLPSPIATPPAERSTGNANEVYGADNRTEQKRVEANEPDFADNRVIRPAETPRKSPPVNAAPTYESENAAPLPTKPISAGVLNGRAISKPQPVYPPAARAVRASGSVIVQVSVDESGRVTNAHAASGHPLLRASAVQAARSTRFEPMKLSGRPVKMAGVLTYNFRPE